jgi:hypothetical protein
MLMRRIGSLGGSVFIGGLLLLSLGASVSAQTEDTAKGASLLAEARKALGGEDKLVAVKRLQVKGEMRRGQGNNTLEGDTEVFLELPDKFRRNESLSIGPGLGGIDRVAVGALAAVVVALAVAAATSVVAAVILAVSVAVAAVSRTAAPINRRASIPNGSRSCSYAIDARKWRVCSSRFC